MTYDPEKYLANREAMRISQRSYCQRNRDKLLAKQKSYDDEHRETINTRMREKKYGGKMKTKVEI